MLSFGDVAFPQSVEAFEFVLLHVSIVVLVASWVLESEERKDLVGSGDIDGFELSLVVIGLGKIRSELVGDCLVGKSVQVGQTE